MKRFYISSFAFCMLFVSAIQLYSYDRSSSSDTTWIYDFSSDTDSTFRQIKLYSEYDSADIQESKAMISDQLDGSWQLGTQFRKTYNKQGEVSINLKSTWNAVLTQWEESNLYEYFYDQWGNDTLYYTSYKFGSDDWVNAQGNRYENTYNENSQLIQVISFKGYPGQENEYEKFEYSYDETGNRVLSIRYNYGMDWALNARFETSFDNEGRKVEEFAYFRMGDEWEESTKTVLEYDASGNSVVLEVSTWDSGTSQWNMTNREDNTYDPLGKLVLKTHQRIVAYGEPMVITRYEYFYNLSGKLETTVISVLDEGTGEYVLTQKEFTRHGGDYFILSDSLCSGETYSWEGESFNAGGTYRKEYISAIGLDSIYNLYLNENPVPGSFSITGPSGVNLDQEVLYIAPVDQEVQYNWAVENGIIISGTENDTLRVRWETLGTWEVATWSLNLFGCSSDTTTLQVLVGETGTNNLPTAGIRFYPVPVQEILQVDYNLGYLEIHVLDLAGRKVAVATGTSIDLSHLSAGPYVVQLYNANEMMIRAQKIIKE